jgi:hypothetical protein
MMIVAVSTTAYASQGSSGSDEKQLSRGRAVRRAPHDLTESGALSF